MINVIKLESAFLQCIKQAEITPIAAKEPYTCLVHDIKFHGPKRTMFIYVISEEDLRSGKILTGGYELSGFHEHFIRLN